MGAHPEREIHVVLDNLNTHTPAALYETFEPAEAKRIVDRLEFHYTPKHGSWLNMVEIEIGVLCEQCLADRIPDEETLCREITAWETVTVRTLVKGGKRHSDSSAPLGFTRPEATNRHHPGSDDCRTKPIDDSRSLQTWSACSHAWCDIAP